MLGGKLYHKLGTLETVLAAVIGVLIGIGLLYVAGRNDWMATRHGLRSVLDSLAGLLIASVALGVLWELVGKRAFARQILNTARTIADIDTAGLTHVGTNYLDDPDWETLFTNVTKLDIFFVYGRTWRNINHSRLSELAAQSGVRIRVYLPDPNDVETLRRLADRFTLGEQGLKDAIQESRDYFVRLADGARADVRVYHRAGDHTFSCYRFDKTAVLTMHTHTRSRTNVPTFVCRDGGSLYEFVRAEFRAIEEQSQQI